MMQLFLAGYMCQVGAGQKSADVNSVYIRPFIQSKAAHSAGLTWAGTAANAVSSCLPLSFDPLAECQEAGGVSTG